MQSKNIKKLPISCYNGPSCNSIEPDYIQQGLFIDITNVIIIKTNQE